MSAVFRSHLDPVEERRRRRIAALSLVILAVFLAAQALMVRSYGLSQKRPPSWDQAIHMEIALDYREAAKSGRWSDIMHLAPKPGMPPFPPLYHLALMHSYDSPDPAAAALWVNWFYLAVFVVSLFFICFGFRPDWAAAGAVVAFASSPAIQELLLTQLIDLSVAAWVAAGYWALLASEDFTAWFPSLAFGVVYGVGMLHKWSYFSYMIPAYLLVLKGLADKRSRLKVLSAAIVALALFFPWYYAHVAVLIPRLFQATADFAVPVTQGGAWYLYFLVSADTLGPLLWALGWSALAVPSYRDRAHQSWVVYVWGLGSYIFWSIVPNRQMRFILPGLPALAAAMCGAWPTPLIWGLAAFQIFGAMNYSTGWISELRIPLPLHSIAIFPSNAPAAEDWHVRDILQAAQSQAEPGRPVANLTFVGNAPYFNGTTFTWEAKRLKLPTLHIRGVNKRLCEFSEFVLLKDANLGPDGVTEGLPEAAAIVRSSTTWFARAYEKAGTWPLPDGSNAVLYKQRKLAAAPFKTNGVQFMFYTSGPFIGNDFRVQMEPWNKSASEYPSTKATASSIELRGIKISRAAITFDHAVFVPASDDMKAPEWDEIRFLKVGRMKIDSAEIASDDLRAYIEGRVKGLKFDKFSIDKTVSATGRVGPFAFAVELGLELLDSPKRLKATILQARLGATSLPAGLLGGYREFSFPLKPSPETPFDIELAGLSLRDGKLTIP